MKITEVANVETMNNPHGIAARKLYDSEHAMAVHLTLKPGEHLKKHITPVDVFFYALEGTGIIEVGEEKKKLLRILLLKAQKIFLIAFIMRAIRILRFLLLRFQNLLNQQNFSKNIF